MMLKQINRSREVATRQLPNRGEEGQLLNHFLSTSASKYHSNQKSLGGGITVGGFTTAAATNTFNSTQASMFFKQREKRLQTAGIVVNHQGLVTTSNHKHDKDDTLDEQRSDDINEGHDETIGGKRKLNPAARLNLTTAEDSLSRSQHLILDETSIEEERKPGQRGAQRHLQQTKSASLASRSKNYSQKYYYKYIHEQNRNLLRSQKQERLKFIPQKDAEISNFKQKFMKYMDILNKEEEKEQALLPPHKRNNFKFLLIDEKKKKNQSSKLASQEHSIDKKKQKHEDGEHNNTITSFKAAHKHKANEGSENHKAIAVVDSLAQSPDHLPIKNKRMIGKKQVDESSNTFTMSAIKHKSQMHSLGDRFNQTQQHALDHSGKFKHHSLKDTGQSTNITVQNLNKQKFQYSRQDTKDFQNSLVTGQNNQNLDVSPNHFPKFSTQHLHPHQHKRGSQLVYQENLKKLKEKVKGEHFKTICQDDSKQQYRNSRLTKVKLKQFLSIRYGGLIAEKLSMIVDFNNPVDFASFVSQVESFLRNKELMRQVAFDVYDFNNDGKVSEMDMFKLFQFFDRDQQKIFEEAFQKDFILMTKMIQHKKQQREFIQMQEETPTLRGKYFRNQNECEEGNFESKRKQLFSSMYKVRKMKEQGFLSQGRGNQNSRNQAQGGVNGFAQNLQQLADIDNLIAKIIKKRDKRNKDSFESEDENNSDNQGDRNDDIWNSVFFKHQRSIKASSGNTLINMNSGIHQGGGASNTHNQRIAQASGNSLSKAGRSSSLQKNNLNSYQQQKYLKQATSGVGGNTSLYIQEYKLNSESNYRYVLSSNAGQQSSINHNNGTSQGPGNDNMNSISLLQNPKWDDYFNSYMEEAQKRINEFIILDEFNKLPFNYPEIPCFIIDFIDYITGAKGFFAKILTDNLIQKQSQNKRNEFQTQDHHDQTSLYHSNNEDDQTYLNGNHNNNNTLSKSNNNLNLPIMAAQNTSSQLGVGDQTHSQSHQNRDFENQIINLRQELSALQFNSVQGAFLILAGSQPPSQEGGNGGAGRNGAAFGVEKASLVEHYVTEQSLIENFQRLFGGYKCDIFAKFIYLFLSDGKDCKQIDFLQFANAFLPLLDDRKEKRNMFIFRLLDLDDDGRINILNVIQLYKNLNPQTRLGQEVYRLLLEYKNKNILLKSGFRSQIVLNFSTFNKIVPYSCLASELQYRFFGGIYPQGPRNVMHTNYMPQNNSMMNARNMSLLLQQQQFAQQAPPSPFEIVREQDEWKFQHGLLGSGTTAEYFITNQQYENLFKESELLNAPHIIAKLK